MNLSNQSSVAARWLGCFPRRPALRALMATLALGLFLVGCGSSKPTTTHAAHTNTAAAAQTQTTQLAKAQRAKRQAAAQRHARAAAARHAAHARAVRLQAKGAAAARAAAQQRVQRAAAAKKRAQQQAAAQQPSKANSKTKPTSQTTPKLTSAIVSVNQTGLGAVLINANGRTLYIFAKDPHGQSACSTACAAVWPPLITQGKPVAGQGASQAKLGTTTRAGGILQVTYKGHPLYLYVGDLHGGQTTGEGLKQFGGLWWAISPAGQEVVK